VLSESDCRGEASKYILVFRKSEYASDIFCVFQVLTDRTHERFGREILVL